MKKIFSLFAVALMSASMFADPNIVTPTISGETEFTDSVIVTMSCPSPNTDIYYTTDGTTDPKCDCDAAPEYKKPIIIRETTVIKAAAFDGDDWSGVAEVTFTKVAARPDTAFGVNHEEEDVMAIYCNHYATNNLHYDVQHWESRVWEELTLGVDSTKVYYCASMAYDGLASNPIEARDFSAYQHLHFDAWVPDTVMISLTVETAAGVKHHCPFRLNAGWNTVDCNPEWWDKEGAAYDWKDVKFFIFDQYMTLDSTSYEGNPFAFANIYFWNDPAPKNIPATAPAAPTMAEDLVQALFSATYLTRTFNFAPTKWGVQDWLDYAYTNGQHIWYTEAMTWDGFTNWDASSYNLTEYDMMHADVYVTVASKLKFTFEALSAGDGGSGWKNGTSVDLVANQWNSIDVDLLASPLDSYDFTDMRYLILEGFKNPDGSSAEGTPLAIANVYFWNSMNQGLKDAQSGKTATKVLRDGQLIIIKNGVEYNAVGTKF